MKIIFRIGLNILVFVSIFTMPWWLTLLLIISGIAVFKNYFESVVAALLLDGYWGGGLALNMGENLNFTILVVLMLIVAMFAKSRLKFY